MLPLITIIASMMMQWGSFQANSANVQRQMTEYKADCEKRLERIELKKADNEVMNEKFENIDFKLDLIMKSLGIEYHQKSERDTL